MRKEESDNSSSAFLEEDEAEGFLRTALRCSNLTISSNRAHSRESRIITVSAPPDLVGPYTVVREEGSLRIA